MDPDFVELSVPLTKIQQGAIGQTEAAKLFMMGSDGKLEISNPVSDDDRRDQEVHVRGQFGLAAALQIKTTGRVGIPGAPYRLAFAFNVRKERIVTHPLFWYLFAYLDPKTMAFGDPVFLVPSALVHTGLREANGKTYIDFSASMRPTSNDRWRPYRVHPANLGKRMLQILKTNGRLSQAKVALLPAPGSDLIWVGTHRAAA